MTKWGLSQECKAMHSVRVRVKVKVRVRQCTMFFDFQWTYFVKFIPISCVWYFLLISASICSLLTCKNAVDFCILALCLMTLPNSVISFITLIGSLGFSLYRWLCHLRVKKFYFFISFSCLITLAMTISIE